MILSLLLSCSDPTTTQVTDDPADTTTDTPDSSTTDTEPDCTALQAMFFDLGNTLLAKGDDDLYAAVPGAETLLDALEERGMTLGVITNVPDDWGRPELDALLADPGILDRFAVVMLSSQASEPKPDPVIFTEALALLPSPPPIAQVAFVTEELGHLADGDPATVGAQATGMVGVHLSDETASELADHTLAPADLAALSSQTWLDCLEE